MRPVSDAFLLTMAAVAASLVGLFLVGVFFYVESGLQRSDAAGSTLERYIRAATRITLIAFVIPVGLSLALVVLELLWVKVLFVVLSLLLLLATIDHIRIAAVTTAGLVNAVMTASMALVVVVTPWALGGLRPTRENLTWAIVLAFAAGVLSIGSTVLSVLDVARLGSTGRAGRDGYRKGVDPATPTAQQEVRQSPRMPRTRLHLTFPQHLMSQPIVHTLGADFDLVVNIRRANLEEERGGWLIVEVTGEDDRVAAATAWLAEQGLQVDRIEP